MQICAPQSHMLVIKSLDMGVLQQNLHNEIIIQDPSCIYIYIYTFVFSRVMHKIN